LSQVGRGIPDLLVGFRGQNWLVELKPNKKASFTEAQVEFWKAWRGQKAIIYNSSELMVLIGAVENPRKLKKIQDRVPHQLKGTLI
jgi:hypothetical protein